MNTHLRTAFEYIKRSPFQALAALFVLTLTFFVGTVLAVLVYSSNNLLEYFETRPQIIAFLKEEVTPETISALQNELISDSRVEEVRYVSKEEALAIYKEATSDNPLLSELVSPTIFPASLELSVTDLSFAEGIIDELKQEGIVDQVGFTASVGGEKTLSNVVTRLRDISFYLRVFGGGLVGVLVATSFLVLLIIISMRMSARKGEVEILSLIGATPGFIRSPIIIEALLYAFIGVGLGWLLALITWLYLTPNVLAYFGEIPVLPRTTSDFLILFGIIGGLELLLGFSLALFGSLLAVARAQKAK